MEKELKNEVLSLIADIKCLLFYTEHSWECEIGHTDFCTCGLANHKKVIRKDIQDAENLIK